MITVKVCSHCKMQSCDMKKGIDIFEELKKYKELFEEKNIEFDLNECGCLESCKGPVVKINEAIYTEVNSEKLEAILSKLIYNENLE